MAVLYRIGETYLSNQVLIENGGVTGFVLNNLDFNNGAMSTTNIQNITLWMAYIKEFALNATRLKPVQQNMTYIFSNHTDQQNPNRMSSVWMILWLVTFIPLIAALFIVMLMQYKKDKKNQKEMKEFIFKLPKTSRCLKTRTTTKRFIIIYVMALVILTWTIFTMLLCTTQYLVNSKFANNSSTNSSSNSTQSYGSVNDAVSKSFGYLSDFIDIITNKTGAFLESSLTKLTIQIRNQVNTSIIGFGTEVLIVFNITDLFNTAQMVITSINQVVNSMTFINSRCQNILADVDKTKGSITVYKNNIDNYLTKICPALKNNPSIQSICQNLQINNSPFQVPIQTGSVSSSSSVIMLFVLQQYNINITEISDSFLKIDYNFKTNLNALFASVINRFDIASYLVIIKQIWGNFLAMIDSTIKAPTSYSTTFDSALNSVSKYENVAIILVIVCIVIMVLFVLSWCFRDSIQDRFFQLNRCFDFFVQFLFIMVLIISAILSVILLTVANFSQSEICNQINTNSGINVLDQMINNKLASPWITLTQSAVSSNQNVNLTLVQPKNILTSIKYGCRDTSVGLLNVLGMDYFVNVTKIVRSPSVMAIVNNAANDSLKAFLDVNPSQIIPPNLSSFFAQTATLIGYFDGINYILGINELQKPLVGIVDFVGYFQNLSSFAINASLTIGWTSDLLYFNDTVNQLQTLVPSFNLTQTDVNTLCVHFQVLQRNRNNSNMMNKLMSTLTTVQNLFNNSILLTSIFSNIYSENIPMRLLNSLTLLISDGINSITRQMLPCNDLSMIFEALTTTFCSNTNLVVSIATLGIILLIVTVLGQIILALIIISISLRMNIEDNTSKC